MDEFDDTNQYDHPHPLVASSVARVTKGRPVPVGAPGWSVSPFRNGHLAWPQAPAVLPDQVSEVYPGRD